MKHKSVTFCKETYSGTNIIIRYLSRISLPKRISTFALIRSFENKEVILALAKLLKVYVTSNITKASSKVMIFSFLLIPLNI